MRVTFLTHYYPPEVGAAQARISGLAAGLAERGWDVTVHAPPPHYPSGVVAPPWRAGGRAVERHGDVRVVRSPVVPSANSGFSRRIANHVSFAAAAVVLRGDAGPADVVVVETPPLFTAAAGTAYARAGGAGLVVNASDRWPASAVELGALTDPRAIAAAEAVERHCYRAADAVTVPTSGLVAALEALPEAAGKVHRLGPAVRTGPFDGIPPLVDAAPGPVRVLYAGTLGLAQGLRTLVDAARLAGPAVVSVDLVGDGAEAAALAAAAADLPHVRVRGKVTASEVPALYAGADLGAVVLLDRPVLHGALPTKMLEVMAAGRPVLLSAAGEAADLVRETGCGVEVAPEDPAALAAVLRDAAAGKLELGAMGRAGRAAVAERFGFDAFVDGWANLLLEVSRRDVRPSWRAAPGRRPSG